MHLFPNNLLQVSKPVSKPVKAVEDSTPKKTAQETKEAGKSETVSKGKKTADTVSIWTSYVLSCFGILTT